MPTTDTSTAKNRPLNAKSISDYIGQTFSHLTILGEAPRDPKYPTYQFVLCRCACGVVASRNLSRLLRGKVLSCGCGLGRLKHGHAHDDRPSRTYTIWHSMLQRCLNPNSAAFRNYGARGITVCEGWKDFPTFLADMGEPPSPRHTLDRKDNSLGYCKENCRWATKQEQCRNTRQNRYLTFKEQTLCIAEWVEVTGLTRKTIESRLAAGWDVERTLTTPHIPPTERWKMRKNARR